MKSIASMLEQISGLTDKDLTQWERTFVDDIWEKFVEKEKRTEWISSKQVEIIDRIYRKHFA